ncbi:MAG TPA: PEGA domain-containing protein [Vicinamibacterales bacterium]|nr:PEGA domain-containing protein [Vicinamibacterales bacterium]
MATAPSRTYGYATPRGYSVRGYAYGGRAFYRGGYGYIAPTRFISPYYAFRPRFSLGFGIYAGFPFGYSYPFYNPYYYGYPYAYDPYYDYGYGYSYPSYPSYGSYPAYPQTYGNTYVAPGGNGYVQSNFPPAGSSNGSVQPQQQAPSNQNMGGVSFEITPSDAKIYVDGIEMGTVGQFTPMSQPLGIDAGRHKIEIRAQGYHTITFDADIVAGQVIPYQGQMQR